MLAGTSRMEKETIKIEKDIKGQRKEQSRTLKPQLESCYLGFHGFPDKT